MNLEVELPDMGDTAGDQATVSEWHVDEGEFVDENERLVEVVAGDFTIDVPSPAEGVLIERMVNEGDMVRVGDVVALIESRGEMDFLPDEDEDEGEDEEE